MCEDMVLAASGSWYRVPAYITTTDLPAVPGLTGGDGCYDKARRTAAPGRTPGNKTTVSAAMLGSITPGQADSGMHTDAGGSGDAATAFKASTQAGQSGAGYTSHADKLVYKGEAEIFSGPMTVTSMTQPNTYTSAWFQYVRLISVEKGTEPVRAPKGTLVVSPFTYHLTFVQPGGAAY